MNIPYKKKNLKEMILYLKATKEELNFASNWFHKRRYTTASMLLKLAEIRIEEALDSLEKGDQS